MSHAGTWGGAHRSNRRIDPARPETRTALLATAIAALLAVVVWSPWMHDRVPGDPAGIAGDARLARCGGTVADVEWGFAIPHARDIGRYVPALAKTSELDLDQEALVVIYRGAFPAAASASAAPIPASTRNVCVYVGAAESGELNYYGKVPVAGMRATPDGPPLVAAPRT